MNDQSGDLLESIGCALMDRTGLIGQPEITGPETGGQINRCMVITYAGTRYFVKLNAIQKLEMFEAEQEGLLELAGSGAARVPQPLCCGTGAGQAFLVMEHLSLRHRGEAAQLGNRLAAQHRVTRNRFGWHRNNTIGLTPQINSMLDDWPQFWKTHRLGFQLELAKDNGYGRLIHNGGERLLEGAGEFFRGYRPPASLLHGDLWSGNHAYLDNGEPVIFDPAVYFGDRETDLAMTELFGGFGQEFHAAYRASFPLDAGYETRKRLYNLYHVLNHLNLFGGGYLGQAESMIQGLVAELG